MTQVVVFDLGGVLIDWDPLPALVAAVGSEEAHRLLGADDFDFYDWNARQDAGRTFAEAEAEAAATHPRWTEHVRGYFPNYPRSLVGQHDDTVALLHEVVATGIPVYGLTNWSAETFPHALERFGFLDAFTEVLVSGDLGAVKPNPRVYEELVRRSGAPAAEIFFTDDNARNVAGARACGLDAVQFVDAPTLRDELVARGCWARAPLPGLPSRRPPSLGRPAVTRRRPAGARGDVRRE